MYFTLVAGKEKFWVAHLFAFMLPPSLISSSSTSSGINTTWLIFPRYYIGRERSQTICISLLGAYLGSLVFSSNKE